MDKEQKDLVVTFTETFPGVVMVEDAMKLALRLHKQVDDASSEIERLRKELEIYKDLYATEIVKRVAGE